MQAGMRCVTCWSRTQLAPCGTRLRSRGALSSSPRRICIVVRGVSDTAPSAPSEADELTELQQLQQLQQPRDRGRWSTPFPCPACRQKCVRLHTFNRHLQKCCPDLITPQEWGAAVEASEGAVQQLLQLASGREDSLRKQMVRRFRIVYKHTWQSSLRVTTSFSGLP